MTSPKLKTYRVKFAVVDYYTIDVRATGPDSAIEIARKLRGEHGEDPDVGFVFDIIDGGDDFWQVEEVDQ